MYRFTYRAESDEYVFVFRNHGGHADAFVTVGDGDDPRAISVTWQQGCETPEEHHNYLVMLAFTEGGSKTIPLVGCQPLWASEYAIWCWHNVGHPMKVAAYQWAAHAWGRKLFSPGRKLIERASRLDVVEGDLAGAREARMKFLDAQGRQFLKTFGRDKIYAAGDDAVDTIGLVREWRRRLGENTNCFSSNETEVSLPTVLATRIDLPSAEWARQDFIRLAPQGADAMARFSFAQAELLHGELSKPEFGELRFSGLYGRQPSEFVNRIRQK